ncbi:phosphotyrosine protein phosphatase [Pilimelia columellifera]|uniref:protein-tyrosine-phosphatase n=1 Tax=Pilimelia columellifera subsp. columellifera TaxID=706583 RepID=A0ABN3NH63_9ACTN
MSAPFVVLHVCMGNICRSPMAERLLALAVRERVAAAGWSTPASYLLHSHGAGTGGWHVGQPMNAPASRQLLARGAETTGFAARMLRGEHIESSDLILTATAEQAEQVQLMRPDAADRTFVLGEFGRLLRMVDRSSLPVVAADADAVCARGMALVGAVNKARAGLPPRPGDDLADPYGLDDHYFGRIADQIEATVRPLAAVLIDSEA